MATDKQIFELPDITLEILQSGIDISFVAQAEGYGLDFQVPASVMAEFVNGEYQIGVTSGTPTPDNANGANGDLYFKANGVIYQKQNGAWVSVASFPLQPVITFTLDTTKSAPYTLTSPQLASVNAFGRYPNFIALIGGTVSPDIQPTYTGAVGAFSAITIALHDNGSGMNADTTVVQFS